MLGAVAATPSLTPRRPSRRAAAVTLATGLLATLALAPSSVPAGVGPLVAVAANLTTAAEAIARAFEADTGIAPRLSFGSSGNLARLVMRGAPYELFLSADEDFPRRLQAAGHTLDEGVRYATGALALYLPPGSPVAPPPVSGDSGAAITTALTHPGLRRLAMANPEHAPYGRAARETLEHLKLWRALENRLVLGENVAQSARFALTGDVQAALLPLALALAPELSGGRHVDVPGHWHAPLHQRMVLLKGAGAAARRFHDYMLGPVARAILARHGYGLPPARD